jgi:hypothetical protein
MSKKPGKSEIKKWEQRIFFHDARFETAAREALPILMSGRKIAVSGDRLYSI